MVAPCGDSDRVVEVDELTVQAETLGQVFGQRLDAITFAGVVAGGEVGDAGLARQMHRLLGDSPLR
jgi:predicted methyltransferase MtxX (methanogen marker protein 4)